MVVIEERLKTLEEELPVVKEELEQLLQFIQSYLMKARNQMKTDESKQASGLRDSEKGEDQGRAIRALPADSKIETSSAFCQVGKNRLQQKPMRFKLLLPVGKGVKRDITFNLDQLRNVKRSSQLLR